MEKRFFVCSSIINFQVKISTQTKDKIGKYYGNPTLLTSMVKKGLTIYRFGRISTSDYKLSWSPIEVATLESILKTHKVEAHRRLKVSQIGKPTAISFDPVVSISNAHWGMEMVSTIWVQHCSQSLQTYDNFSEMFGFFRTQSEQIFGRVHNRGQSIYS